MESVSDEENESEIENIRLLATALEADKCEKTTAKSSQDSVNSVSPTAAQGDVTLPSRIETALAFNRIMEEKLKRLESVLIKRLEECKERLQEVHKITSAQTAEPINFRYVTCGRPYFKDKHYFPCPANEDAVTMQENAMFDFNNVSCLCGWTVKDKREFANAILKESREAKRKELESEIARLRREAYDSGVNVEKICKKLNKELDALPKKSIAQVAFPLDKEYDWDMFSNVLKNRHKPQEFRAMWKLYLHPSINKAEWSRQEQDRLLTIAEEHQFKDWENIAKELGTSRTGYQCFVFYRTSITNPTAGQKWTREEEEYLKRLIALYKDGNYIPWPKITAKMPTRSKMQIYGKYLRTLDLKGRFHKEEDDVLLTCVNKFGPNFKKIANEFLVGRTFRQLRCRYRSLKSSKRISAMWTPDEDKRLVQFVSHNITGPLTSTHGINFANLVAHFPGKTRAHLRTRYVTLIRWMRLHPRVDLSKAPRRAVRRLGHGGVVDDLSSAVERLKKKLTSECQKTPKLKISVNSSEHEIDDAITTTIINEEQKKVPVNKEHAISINDGKTILEPQVLNSQHLSNLLILLRAKLDKIVFKKSRNWASKYPNLLNQNMPLPSPATITSYSRKKPVSDMKMLGSTDIWGNALLSHTEYVLPPHLSTITGLRKLMQYVIEMKNSKDSSHNFCRKNTESKTQYDLLVNRFQQLFLWPMILSNYHPNKLRAKNYRGTYVSSEFKLSPEPVKKTRATPKRKQADFIGFPRVKKVKKDRHGQTDDTTYKMDEIEQVLLDDMIRKPAMSLHELDQ